MPLFQGPDFTCPHCGEAGIRWADKWRCANHATLCECSHCGGYSKEAPGERVGNTLFLYVSTLAIAALSWLLLGYLPGDWQGAVVFIGAPAIGAVFLLLRYGGVYLSAQSIPLVPVFPSKRWKFFRNTSGATWFVLLLFALVGLMRLYFWLKGEPV